MRHFISKVAVPLIAALSVATMGTTSAVAADWTIIPEQSSISFSVTQSGQLLTGKFDRFSGQIAFEPGEKPTGEISIDIDTSSFHTGIGDIDGQALTDDWFATARVPNAHFTAATFRRNGPDSFEAEGTLTVKDTSQPLILPFTLHVGADGIADVEAHKVISRSAFKVGTGAIADTNIVSEDVSLDIVVHARARQ